MDPRMFEQEQMIHWGEPTFGASSYGESVSRSVDVQQGFDEGLNNRVLDNDSSEQKG